VGYWEQRRVLVTGGGSFIGSHLVEALRGRGAHVRVADDFWSGRRENLYLTEEMVGPPYDPDDMYGLAKVAGELTLRALHREHAEVRGYLGRLLTERPAPGGWQVPAGLAGRPR
jgi:nucleoside-diphosphate-sugar epimerase